MTPPEIFGPDGRVEWGRVHAVVAGLGTSGYAAADGLLSLGARVTVLDDSESPEASADLLRFLDATVELGCGATSSLPQDTDLLVVSSGWGVHTSVSTQAAARGIPTWGEAELAWQMLSPTKTMPWLGITGERGAATAARYLASILRAAGLVTDIVGNNARPITEAILDEVNYDVLVVGLNKAQLMRLPSARFHSAAVLNVGGSAESQSAAARIYEGITHTCVYNVAEEAGERLVASADVVEGARAVGITKTIPAVSMVGVVEGLIVDRAFVAQRRHSALELAKVSDLANPETLDSALAAAALARSLGVPATAVEVGLREHH